MKIKAKVILSAAALVALIEILIGISGTPKGVDPNLSSTYQFNFLFACFLASCGLVNGLFGYIRPGSLWTSVSGICFPLGTLVYSLCNYLLCTSSPAPSSLSLAGFGLLLVGFISFFAAVTFSQDHKR